MAKNKLQAKLCKYAKTNIKIICVRANVKADYAKINTLAIYARVNASKDCIKIIIMIVCIKTNVKKELQEKNILKTIDGKRIKYKLKFIVRLITNKYYKIQFAIYLFYC